MSITVMQNLEFEPIAWQRRQIKCLLCGGEFASIGHRYEAHAFRQHRLRQAYTGKHYLFFVDFNGRRQYYTRNNKQSLIPVEWDGALHQRPKDQTIILRKSGLNEAQAACT